MNSLNITGFYLGLLALLYLALTANIIRYRLKFQVGIGSNGNQTLAKAIRVHANFIEYTPIALLLLACYEFNGGSEAMVHALGAAFFVGRVLHVKGLSSSIGVTKERQLGMLSSFLVIATLSALLIFQFVLSNF
ncbi:MAPEG family protein [Thalassotalea fusca]